MLFISLKDKIREKEAEGQKQFFHPLVLLNASNSDQSQELRIPNPGLPSVWQVTGHLGHLLLFPRCTNRKMDQIFYRQAPTCAYMGCRYHR